MVTRFLLAILLFLITFLTSANTLVFDSQEVRGNSYSQIYQVDLKEAPFNTPGVYRTKRISLVPARDHDFLEPEFPITARNVLVADEKTNYPLFVHSAHEVVPLASITKLMTSIVMLDKNLNFDDIVEIKESDLKGGVPEYLLIGESAKVKDLWNMMLVSSSNTALTALVRHLGLNEDEFVQQMQEKANELFLFEVRFKDPTGLSPDNQGSARNVARISHIAFSRPEISKAVTLSDYEFITQNTGRPVKINSTDWLLNSYLNRSPYKILGGKTGYLDESKYNLVLSVRKYDHDILVVVLGSESQETRFQEVAALARWAFNNYKWSNNISAQ